MAENVRRYIDLSSDEYVNKRDKAMYDNYVWQRAHKPDRNKVVVWCATVHAAKDLSFLANGRLPLGSFIQSVSNGIHDGACSCLDPLQNKARRVTGGLGKTAPIIGAHGIDSRGRSNPQRRFALDQRFGQRKHRNQVVEWCQLPLATWTDQK